MNREEVEKFYETIEEKNRKLENAIDEIENFLNKSGDDLVDDYSLFSETSFYEELVELIKKAKGE